MVIIKTIYLIQNYYPNLTKAEKRIADFIIGSESDSLTTMTLVELAGRLELGEATIVRFCRKIGFKGFPDLKFALALDHSQIQPGPVEGSYLDAIEHNMASVIHQTRQLLDQSALERAIDLIIQSKHTFFYGAGSSGLVAAMAEERFLRFGQMTKSIRDSHAQYAHSAVCGREDVVVVFSLSGSTLDVYQAVGSARENGAVVVAITNHITSPIAKLADCVLLTCGREDLIEGSSLASMISQMYVLDALCATLIKRNRERSHRSMAKVAKSINIINSPQPAAAAKRTGKRAN